MENIDFVILIFSLIIILNYIFLRRRFVMISVILYIILSLFMIIQAYYGYNGVVDLFIKIGEGSPGAVPDIIKGIYITFGLFMLYGLINIILFSMFYKKQLKVRK